ncbi:MAG: type II toxin-antitoxin system HicA family toxin [Terriglobia bacterium]
MKLPRDLSGSAVVKALERRGFTVARQSGSHVRLVKAGKARDCAPASFLGPLSRSYRRNLTRIAALDTSSVKPLLSIWGKSGFPTSGNWSL